jgi:hypothetical protein
MAESIRIENVTIAYPHLFEPNTPPGADKAKWSAEFILDPVRNAQDIARLEAAFARVATTAGKGDMIQYLKSPIQHGDKLNADLLGKGKKARPEIAGKRVVRAADGNYAPTVVDQNRQPISKEQGANIFGGCIVNGFVDLYWTPIQTNPGVYVGLRGVQLVSNVGVEKLGGGVVSPEAMFEVVAGAPAPLSQTGGAGPAPAWM